MINLTRLLCEINQSTGSPRPAAEFGKRDTAEARRPLVVWNITRSCNLKCVHCYADADAREFPGELDWVGYRDVIDSLAAFRVPDLMLSGGEPLIHPLFFYIAGYARERGLRLTLSTNGTLLTPETAKKIRGLDFAFVGISLDGVGEAHDRVRGRAGTFEKAVAAFRNCRAVGQKAGVRVTLARDTVEDLDNILDFIEKEDIPHISFYHLVYSGRGANLSPLEPDETRMALDKIMDRVESWHSVGNPREVFTVDQPADGPYLLLRLAKSNPERAGKALEQLRANVVGNQGSGVGVANIDTQGNVHPDEFWQDHTLGNVRDRLFNRIWLDLSDPVLRELRKTPHPLGGRCAGCNYLELCGGGFRARAWQRFGDPWAEDPSCYLSDSEISGSCPVPG